MKNRYWVRYFLAVGYGAWNKDEMVSDDLEYHRKETDEITNFILEIRKGFISDNLPCIFRVGWLS